MVIMTGRAVTQAYLSLSPDISDDPLPQRVDTIYFVPKGGDKLINLYIIRNSSVQRTSQNLYPFLLLENGNKTGLGNVVHFLFIFL
jgi:hypothetical protein